mgnify:CR=1 FL=1
MSNPACLFWAAKEKIRKKIPPKTAEDDLTIFACPAILEWLICGIPRAL